MLQRCCRAQSRAVHSRCRGGAEQEQSIDIAGAAQVQRWCRAGAEVVHGSEQEHSRWYGDGSDVQMCRCTDVQICKWADAQMCRCAGRFSKVNCAGTELVQMYRCGAEVVQR